MRRALVAVGLVSVPSHAEVLDDRSRRAGSSQGFVAGTALTVPDGSGDYSTRIGDRAVLSTITMGLARTTELWVDGGALFEDGTDDEETMFSLGIGIKHVLARTARWQLAATIAGRQIDERLEMDVDVRTYAAASGVVATTCVDACGVMVSGTLGAIAGGDGIVPMGSIAVSIGSPRYRVQTEVVKYGALDLGFVGGRIAFPHIAVDLGVLLVDAEPTPFFGLAVRL
jgi:hypothetical protein